MHLGIILQRFIFKDTWYLCKIHGKGISTILRLPILSKVCPNIWYQFWLPSTVYTNDCCPISDQYWILYKVLKFYLIRKVIVFLNRMRLSIYSYTYWSPNSFFFFSKMSLYIHCHINGSCFQLCIFSPYVFGFNKYIMIK